MATPSLGDAEFLFGRCAGCAKQVLTYFDLGPSDEEHHRCIHCDEIITADLRAATSAELEVNGYALIEARTCGNGGGCGAGGCGIAKP